MNWRFFIYLIFGTTVLVAVPNTNASESGSYSDAWTGTIRKFFCHKSVHYTCDHRLVHASEIAVKRAHPKMTWRCWHYVKDALIASGAISKRPKSPWAKEAGEELCESFGFTKIPVKNPYDAPVGAVIVYGGPDAGHVELRANSGFVSDFISPTPYPRPLIGVYVKTS